MKMRLLTVIKRLCVSLIFMLSLPVSAWANGAPYAPAALGGIEYQHNDKISIESEVLRVSSKKINVSYIFKSSAQTPLTIDIAFPITVDGDEFYAGEGTRPEGTYEPDLTVFVNGVSVQAVQRILINNIDITEWIEPDNNGRKGKLKDTAKAKAFFDQHSLSYTCETGTPDTKGEEMCYVNSFVDISYAWQQVFNPGETRVDVLYTPMTGGDYYLTKEKNIDAPIGHGFGDLSTDERNPNPSYRVFFCIDDATQQAIKRMLANKEGDWTGYSVMYIWDTARYWQGPIKNFHLIIEKDSPEQVISYCPYVGSKTSPTTFEWKTENFVPQGRLKVFFFPYQVPENE